MDTLDLEACMFEVTAARLVCALSAILREFKISANDGQQLVYSKLQGLIT